MKKVELYTFLNRIKELNNLEGVKFAYAVVKNKKTIQKEVETLEEIKKPSEKHSEYENKRISVCRKYSKKDKEGNPVVINECFDIDEAKKGDFEKELKLLQEEYTKEIKLQNKKIEEFTTLLEEEANIDIHYINYVDLPDNITPSQLEVIYSLIKEK